MKINRKQLRKIILKETRKYNDPRGSIDRTPNIGTSRFGGPRPDHPFYANDYKPSSEVIDIDLGIKLYNLQNKMIPFSVWTGMKMLLN